MKQLRKNLIVCKLIGCQKVKDNIFRPGASWLSQSRSGVMINYAPEDTMKSMLLEHHELEKQQTEAAYRCTQSNALENTMKPSQLHALLNRRDVHNVNEWEQDFNSDEGNSKTQFEEDNDPGSSEYSDQFSSDDASEMDYFQPSVTQTGDRTESISTKQSYWSSKTGSKPLEHDTHRKHVKFTLSSDQPHNHLERNNNARIEESYQFTDVSSHIISSNESGLQPDALTEEVQDECNSNYSAHVTAQAGQPALGDYYDHPTEKLCVGESKTFEQMLEEQLKQEEERLNSVTTQLPSLTKQVSHRSKPNSTSQATSSTATLRSKPLTTTKSASNDGGTKPRKTFLRKNQGISSWNAKVKISATGFQHPSQSKPKKSPSLVAGNSKTTRPSLSQTMSVVKERKKGGDTMRQDRRKDKSLAMTWSSPQDLAVSLGNTDKRTDPVIYRDQTSPGTSRTLQKKLEFPPQQSPSLPCLSTSHSREEEIDQVEQASLEEFELLEKVAETSFASSIGAVAHLDKNSLKKRLERRVRVGQPPGLPLGGGTCLPTAGDIPHKYYSAVNGYRHEKDVEDDDDDGTTVNEDTLSHCDSDVEQDPRILDPSSMGPSQFYPSGFSSVNHFPTRKVAPLRSRLSDQHEEFSHSSHNVHSLPIPSGRNYSSHPFPTPPSHSSPNTCHESDGSQLPQPSGHSSNRHHSEFNDESSWNDGPGSQVSDRTQMWAQSLDRRKKFGDSMWEPPESPDGRLSVTEELSTSVDGNENLSHRSESGVSPLKTHHLPDASHHHQSASPTTLFNEKTNQKSSPDNRSSSPTQVDLFSMAVDLFPQVQVDKTKADPNENSTIQAVKLRQWVERLENEIKRFNQENAALSALKKQKQEAMKRMETEMKAFEEFKEKSKKDFETYKEAENKKLKKERKIFDDYQKALKTMPNKKDRDEIDRLKEQLAEMQEESAQKDNRWQALNNRLRLRVEQLEQEKTELHQRLKVLEEKRLDLQSQLSVAQRKATSETTNKTSRPSLNMVSQAVSFKRAPTVTPLSTPRHFQQPTSVPSTAIMFTSPPKVHSTGVSAQPTSSALHPAVTKRQSLATETRTEPNLAQSNESAPSTCGKQTAKLVRSSSGDGLRTSGASDYYTGEEEASSGTASLGKQRLSRESGGGFELTVAQIEAIKQFSTANKGQIKDEISHNDGMLEKVYSSGAVDFFYPNGSVKEISADGKTVIVSLFNGDMKQTLPDGRTIYYYVDNQTIQTTYLDGTEEIQYKDGRKEIVRSTGIHEVYFPDQTVKYIFPNGQEESVLPSGMIIRILPSGDKEIFLPNGQKEVHSGGLKQRIYPDGTTKTVFLDGRQETRYASGRVRIKDKEGNLIVDTRST